MYYSLPIWRDGTAAQEEAQREARANERIEGPAGGAIILVVEDDAVFRRFLITVLHQHGYRTLEASNAETGWLLVHRLHPAVVVLDYALSCASGANLRTGWDLAERMAANTATRHIPIIFVTGFDGQLRHKLESSLFTRRPEHLMKPVDRETLLAKIAVMVGGSQNQRMRILLADDDPTVAAFVQKVLTPDRFHLEVVNNGEECLHALKSQPKGFDLLLLDLMMPDVSGYDVLRELAQTDEGKALPVLVLTNNPEARNDEERLLLERGVVLDVVAKPAVHENPALLPHIIDWHLSVAFESGGEESSDSSSDPSSTSAAA